MVVNLIIVTIFRLNKGVVSGGICKGATVAIIASG